MVALVGLGGSLVLGFFESVLIYRKCGQMMNSSRGTVFVDALSFISVT